PDPPLSRRCSRSTETRLCPALRVSSTGFLLNPDFPIRCEARPAWLRGILYRATPHPPSHFPSPHREAKERNSSARFIPAQGVREKNFSDHFIRSDNALKNPHRREAVP
ncbi:hypothetical protein M0D69_27240, partial [Caballeronia sp. SEWSISQ10-4 2]|uniref:hypothetical protein n=1 Tax=Caballeronia sp. SEWSISQ10-4 2 TaxID=2937438 RepID=UPI00264FB153